MLLSVGGSEESGCEDESESSEEEMPRGRRRKSPVEPSRRSGRAKVSVNATLDEDALAGMPQCLTGNCESHVCVESESQLVACPRHAPVAVRQMSYVGSVSKL